MDEALELLDGLSKSRSNIQILRKELSSDNVCDLGRAISFLNAEHKKLILEKIHGYFDSYLVENSLEISKVAAVLHNLTQDA